ncbi:hypothetical protein HER32_18920 [Hymenobacter sp. BT18]|uniref:hypothetical protein n=1 Tax=Hymenobacter sp. BT18 TaxID=2835648 RepID=UPI00143E31B2|nr:hypothetical protein [Hymenobacter sp. BT18]QIX63129.1 hypothetical protein HER32_18920 [Hymenobacter sp. BT18]
MKTAHWLPLLLFICAFFQPFIMISTRRLKERFLSDNQKQLLDKAARVVFTLVESFLFLLGAVVLVSLQRNGHKLEMSISESWLWTVVVAALCTTALRLLKKKYPAEESQ